MVSNRITDISQNSGISAIVINEICSIAEKYGISRVVLFGSRARGTFRRSSDIDLAVEGREPELFYLSLEEDTSTLLTFDVVNLNRTVQKELLDSIRKEGITLYEKI